MATLPKKLYPLKFIPLLKERVWGGDNLVKKYHKPIPADEQSGVLLVDGDHIGESWEISDIEGADSVVAEGFLAENALSDIIETYMGDVVGDNIFQFYGCYFPLIVKFLDIKGALSVQVHPDDETAFERFYTLGKDEFWYVLEAEPDAVVYMGFNKEVSASEFYKRCKEGTVAEVLNVFHPKRGDCFHVKPGTVHAASGGIVICEVQEASDITFRLYDWGRENTTQAREMHLEDAIDCIDYEQYDEAMHIDATITEGAKVLEDGSHFTITDLKINKPFEVNMDLFSSFVLYVCIEGSAVLRHSGQDYSLSCGETVMVPANSDDFTILPVGECAELLQIHINPLTEDADGYIDESVSAEIDESRLSLLKNRK